MNNRHLYVACAYHSHSYPIVDGVIMHPKNNDRDLDEVYVPMMDGDTVVSLDSNPLHHLNNIYQKSGRAINKNEILRAELQEQIDGKYKTIKTLYKLYLDDIRNPKTSEWFVVRDVEGFKNKILTDGLPTHISFDHDLGDNVPSGYDAIKWMINVMNYDLRGIDINYHTANPVGFENMIGLVTSWCKFLNNED